MSEPDTRHSCELCSRWCGLTACLKEAEPVFVAVRAGRIDLSTVAYDPATNPYTKLFQDEGLKLCRPGKPPQRPTDGPGGLRVGDRIPEPVLDAPDGRNEPKD